MAARAAAASNSSRSSARAKARINYADLTEDPALQLLESESGISLLFTDVVLPGSMNGRQLADEARRRKPALKVLYATGYTRNAIIHQGRLDAEVELLTKPFTAEALSRKVRQILNAQLI